MTVRDYCFEVEVGDGARMLVPTDAEWHLRYGNVENVKYAAAELIACYKYLIRECTMQEAIRRLRLMRQADGESDDEQVP